MTGIVNKTGSKSGVIGRRRENYTDTNILGETYSGNIGQFIDKTNPFFDCNLNSSSAWNGADFDTNTSQFSRWWDWASISGGHDWGAYMILFGPGYTSVDAANGGWRIGMKFQSKVRIVGCRIMPIKTNARPKHLGLYKMDDTSGTNRTYVPTRYCTSLRGGLRSHDNLTIFSASTSFPQLDNMDDLHYCSYEPNESQYWMWSFGNSYHDAGNTNAGIAGLQIQGSIVL